MISVKHYLLEVDVDSFNKSEGGIILQRIGELHDTLPRHGKIIEVPLEGTFKKGDTAYFTHFESSRIYKKEGKHYINLPKESIIAVQRGEDWLEGTMIPADKIPREKPKTSIILQAGEKQEYEDNRYLIDKEEVWVYPKSPYNIDYVSNKTFLRKSYLVYNKAKDQCLNNFVVLEVLDEQKDYSVVNGIWREKKDVTQRGRARVVKNNKYGLEGEVVFLKSTNNKLGFDNLATVRFQYILGCYEKN